MERGTTQGKCKYRREKELENIFSYFTTIHAMKYLYDQKAKIGTFCQWKEQNGSFTFLFAWFAFVF